MFSDGSVKYLGGDGIAEAVLGEDEEADVGGESDDGDDADTCDDHYTVKETEESLEEYNRTVDIVMRLHPYCCRSVSS